MVRRQTITKCFLVTLVVAVCCLRPTSSFGILMDKEEATGEKSQGEVETINTRTYDPWKSRIAPSEPVQLTDSVSGINTGSGASVGYTLTAARLDEIRKEMMYPYFDSGPPGGIGDYQKDIRDTIPQITKQLNFLLPFFGFGYNYTWLSLHGFLSFSDSPERFDEYPLHFPVPAWPKMSDPSFIAPWYSRCRQGQLRGDETDNRTAGVYFRLERNLPQRTDQFGVELRERLMWDIRTGIIGSEKFVPKHCFISTWKNVTFAGGYYALQKTNTFQAIVATDEIRTYVIYNYQYMAWTTHTEAGGDTSNGLGGTPAFVGFNAGNGTRSYQYLPYSQSPKIFDLVTGGNANGFPGRHIFRIDENIMVGTCVPDYDLTSPPLTFAPESGNMLGGTRVNITGPCFKPGERVTCKFYTVEVTGTVIDANHASCIMPRVYSSGYVDFGVSLQGGAYRWRSKFLIETPLTAHEMVWFQNDEIYTITPKQFMLLWDRGNLTSDTTAQVSISVWGYRENTITPQVVFIDTLQDSVSNTGVTMITPSDYQNRNYAKVSDMTYGMIMINVTDPVSTLGLKTSPHIWSRPIPLAWLFHSQWRSDLGTDWINIQCYNWIYKDRDLRNFASNLFMCPCMLDQATSDVGRFTPDPTCDMYSNSDCSYHQGAKHCVRTGLPNSDGAGQLCCYDKDNYLMLTTDNRWGGSPARYHDFGVLPWNEAGKVPSLSHFGADTIPFYFCCMYQSEQSDGCMRYRLERRATQDCRGYSPPSVGGVFGDPHFNTFDGTSYTFNGYGEFALVRVNDNRHQLNVQGRFEPPKPSILGPVKGTQLTAVACADNTSATAEVRVRSRDMRWRYHLDIIVDGQRVYFDQDAKKAQTFRGLTVWTPGNVLNQSQVMIMFKSGAGVEVVENMGYLTTRVYLPIDFANSTRGLLGNWSFDMSDDFTLPDGTVRAFGDPNSALQSIHTEFGMYWVLDDKEQPLKGKSLFFRENGRSSNFYTNLSFVPEFRNTPETILPSNVTLKPAEVRKWCGDSFECMFDYSVSLDREMALFCKYYQDQLVNIRLNNLKYVVSCGALPTPKHGRKSTFWFTPNTMVKYDCDPGYILVGERRRWCYANGEWNKPTDGIARCMPESDYTAQQAGIATAIVLAVIIPIILMGLCIFLVYRRTHQESATIPTTVTMTKKNTPPVRRSSGTTTTVPTTVTTEEYLPVTNVQLTSTMPASQAPPRANDSGHSSVVGSRESVDSVPDERDGITGSTGSLRTRSKYFKKRQYDAVYYTREPLPGRDSRDQFLDKDWDLGIQETET